MKVAENLRNFKRNKDRMFYQRKNHNIFKKTEIGETVHIHFKVFEPTSSTAGFSREALTKANQISEENLDNSTQSIY